MGTNVEWPTLRRIFIDAFQREGQVMSVGQEASSLTGILGLVTACVGLTVCGMPRFCRDNAIAARPFITDPQVVVETQLAWRRTSINAAMHRFIRDERLSRIRLFSRFTRRWERLTWRDDVRLANLTKQ